VRYRFGDVVLSPAARTLSRDGRLVPLIPRYFDLLLLLVTRRDVAVPRGVIMDAVWSDVVVSDGALSQAVRTLRRCLGDDPREPRFIRTVSRFGYQFVGSVDVEDEQGTAAAPTTREFEIPSDDQAFEDDLTALLATGANGAEGDPRLDAAARLHGRGTAEALRRLSGRAGHARGRALLREARWDVPEAGEVPILGEPAALRVVGHLAWLRLARLRRELELRWAAAAAGGAMVGGVAGAVGGLVLLFGPGAVATPSVPLVLALLGTAAGGGGAAGVAAGLLAAEAVFRSARGLMLVVLGAVGGGVAGVVAHLLALAILEGLFGRAPSPLGGGLEGLVLGGGAAVGYALMTHPREGGMAAPRGPRRLGVAIVTGVTCALAGLGLGLTSRHMGAMSLDFLARSFPGSQVGLGPLARLLGEEVAGSATRNVISSAEGFLFGLWLSLGLTRRPR
jgi:DNA-binding winged helix-turn-helix (wHTH) protein